VANRRVTLMLRVRTENNTRPYLNPAVAGNKKIMPMWAMYQGEARHFPHSSYYLRFKTGKKLIFEHVGNDLSVALIAQRKKKNLLEAVIEGNAILPEKPAGERIRLADAIAVYMGEVSQSKSESTEQAYRFSLEKFRDTCGREYVDQLRREDLVRFMSDLRKGGVSDRTVALRLQHLDTFFLKTGRPRLMKPADWPSYTTNDNPTVYSREELSRLFAAADADFCLLLRFLLGSGARAAEVLHACWSDLDFQNNTFVVRAKEDMGFQPKSRRGRVIPLPADLMDDLALRRVGHPGDKLIFPSKHGNVMTDLLYRLKALAWRAGLSCGECVSKRGVTCS